MIYCARMFWSIFDNRLRGAVCRNFRIVKVIFWRLLTLAYREGKFMFIGSAAESRENGNIYPHVILAVLKYLAAQDFSAMPGGRHEVVLPGSDGSAGIYFNLDRYHTKAAKDCRPERHIKYVDVQYIIEGEECLGWCPLSPDLKEVTPYDPERDIVFYKELVPESSLILMKGNFAVLYPDDVHRPCVAVDEPGEPVTKAVVKIPVTLLEEKA